MPRYLVQPATAKARHITWDLVRRVADAFSTSPVATAIRLVDLDIAPSLLICHKRDGRAWFARSPMVPSRWFPRDQLDAESAAFDLLFGNGNTRRQTRVSAYAWFDRYDADRYEVLEESVLNDAGEMLTILSVIKDDMLEDR